VATVEVAVDGWPEDLALVDLLARLGLAARRLGGRVRVVDASVELRALLDLAGLSAVVTEGTPAGPVDGPLVN
jgi:hypothetical protein